MTQAKTLRGIILMETHAGKPVSERKFTCCICRLPWIGLGNNPWPISQEPNDRCCGPCHITTVTPARIELNRAWRAEIDAEAESDN